MATLGLITIGQSPRPDLEAAFRQHAPEAQIRLVGALDGLSSAEVAALAVPSSYPLLVRLADGSTAQLPLSTIAPLVEEQAHHLAHAGAAAIVVACAGDFPEIFASVPVLLPGTLLPGVVRAITHTRRIGVVTPLADQAPAAEAKWTRDGFAVRVAWASPYIHAELDAAAEALRDPALELIVLDCMGHSDEYRQQFAQRCGRPVILAQSIVARVAGALVS